MADEPSRVAAIRAKVERRLERLADPRAPRSRSGGRGKRAAAARPALIDTPGFELAIVAVMKDEAAYIEEWLCHHIAVGAQHFFLYDNGSTDGVERILDGYIDRGLVTLVRFPMRGLQRDAYNHALRLFGSTSEWLAYVDIDEFLVPAADESVRAVLRRFPDASQVLVSRKEFCFSGHRTRPGGLVTEAYTLASRDVPRVGRADVLAKTIIRPRGIWRMGVHSADTIDRATVNTAGEPSPEGRPAIANPTFENLQINHYYTKSWEEFSAKLARTNTSTHAYQLPEVPFDIPGEPDHVVDRWIPRTKAVLEEMRALSPRPYRYGSHLALPDFPRSDQFRVQAASLISNEVAGLERPRKQRSFDPLPMPGVRGAVARAEDHGYDAAPGRLARSVHAQLQIRWLLGDVAWSAVDPEAPALVTAEEPITITELGPPLREHALLFAIALPGPARIEVGMRVPGGSWEPAVTLPLELAGTYLGFVALDDAPRTLDAVRVAVEGAPRVEIHDLALIAYG